MELLGQNPDAILVIKVKDMILPNTARRLQFPAGMLLDQDVADLMDNPTETFMAVLATTKHNIGVACKFKFIRLLPDAVELNVVGQSRVELLDVEDVDDDTALAFELKEVETPDSDPDTTWVLRREIIKEIGVIDQFMAEQLRHMKNMSNFADCVLDQFDLSPAKKIKLVETASISMRIKEAHSMVIEHKTAPKTAMTEVQELQAKFDSMTLPKKATEEIGQTLRTLSKMSTSASEYPTQLRYAEFALSLPWDNSTTDNEIDHVETELEKSHYGMEKAKERLIEYLAIKKLNPDTSSMTVLLDGPPGTGKTTLAVSLGKAMGRKVERISLGGCSDPSFFKGHGRTYTGSRYGRIMQAIHSSGVNNPIIVLDEVEKVTDGVQGNATATLLEILDPKTNCEFHDVYLGFEFDLSKVIFIATSNERYEISPPVLDRMEYIACDGYTQAEKIKIASKYTIPIVAEDLGVPTATISKPVLKYMIEGYTRESGVRNLEKIIKSCLRAVAVAKTKGKDINVTKKIVVKRLGKRYEETKPMAHTEPGIVTGMYYSQAGGGVLDIEAIITNYHGSGELTITGQCGDVMLESIELVRAHMTARDYGMDGENLKDWDIHLHMPEGATPKDGPSAGGAYALLFASLLLDTPVKEGLCLTGECNLHGHITAIGGVDQKCTGAVRNGFTTVCLPASNKRDWDELPKHIKEGATYHFVETVEELLDIAFEFDDIKEEAVALCNDLAL